MRKREQPQYYIDSIFEPPPEWRATHSGATNSSGFHSPTHRSPLHHQPSLSEMVYQDYNKDAEIQEVYPMYQERQRPQYMYHSDTQATSSSSLHTISTNNHGYEHYDDMDESIDKNVFQQSDAISITNTLFTAVDHLEDQDDSTERHGYLPQPEEDLNTLLKNLNVKTEIVWEDHRPQYRQLNESYDTAKQEIYTEIYATMEKMQALDTKLNKAKLAFQMEMDLEYVQMSDKLFNQCQELVKEKQVVEKSLGQENALKFQNEKVRLNVGGNMFETSLSTLRRDTDSLLATMFSGRHAIVAESDGSYFIDRDPSHFRLVLNYLRDLRIPPTILQDVKIRQELLQEAKYYCIDGLVNILSMEI